MIVRAMFGSASSLLAEFGADRRHRASWVSLSNLGTLLGAIAGGSVQLCSRGSPRSSR